MAELYLVRHGQASFGAANYDELSSSGVTQSRWLGEYFAQRGLRFDRVMTGTMRRHAQTADALLTAMGGEPMEIVQDADLNEYDFRALFSAFGESRPADGALAEEDSMKHFFKALKHVLQLWSEDKLPGCVPETWAQFQARVERARLAIQRAGGKRVLVVSSGGPIAVLSQQVLQAPAAAAIALNMQIRNSSVSQYVFHDSAMSLVTFNTVPHLEQPERRNLVTHG
jgi:broad specificity phosphatase PhoE